MRLRDSVALVTGASSGIGRASARELAQAGARVLVHGRDRERLAELAREIDAVPLPGDLSQPGAAAALAAAAQDAAGAVDLLVNNAGEGWAGPFREMDPADIARLVQVNLVAPVALTRAVLPQMLVRGRGYLLFVTSIAGRMGVAGEAVYAGTKAGLDTFAESLRFELSGTGVGVGVLVPGVVDTGFFARRGRPYQRRRPVPLPPGTVARALVATVEAGRAERYAPRWLRLPVAVRGAAPALYRRLATRFGEHPERGGEHPEQAGRHPLYRTLCEDQALSPGPQSPSTQEDRAARPPRTPGRVPVRGLSISPAAGGAPQRRVGAGRSPAAAARP